MGFRDLITNMLAAPKPGAKSIKSSLAGPMIAWSNVGQPKWTQRRYDALAEAGFRKNVVAYRCVMQVAVASSAIPWLLYANDGAELDRHPLLDLLRHPNPLQDGMAFLESVYAYLQIAGNVFIEAVKPNDGDAPVELYVLRPDRMKVIPGPAGLPQGYQYSCNGQTTTWPADPITGFSNILHIRNFHPLDDWYGMSPLEAAQVSIDQHNAAGSWNQALLNQGARPSGALVYAPKDGAATLTDDQMHRLREEFGQLYQGATNAGRPLILEGGLDWRDMSLSPKDMDWLGGRNVAARDIALAFGVPAQLIGIPDAQTYANMAEARLALYEETVLPLVNRVIGAFDHWLSPMYEGGLELDFDPDEVSALALRRDTQWNKLQATDFLTINEKRHAIGYGPIEGGDVLDGGNRKPAAVPTAAFPFTSPKFGSRQTSKKPVWNRIEKDFGDDFGDDAEGDGDNGGEALDIFTIPEVPDTVDEPTPTNEPPPGYARPEGVPDHWTESPTDGPGGTQFTDPDNPGNSVRLMPGNPDSDYPNSQEPYVRWQMNGQALDADGNPLPNVQTPDAHIPMDEFEIPPDFFELP